MSGKMKYQVRVLTECGYSYLVFRGRDSWTARTARKHAQDIVQGKTGIKDWLSVAVVDEFGNACF